MATSTYLNGRSKYARPQAMLWSDNQGQLDNGFYVPLGYEIGQVVPDGTPSNLINQFIILSDDNRSPIDVSFERIEKRERTINGRMRSYHIADKRAITMSWDMLPSRAFSSSPNFDEFGASDKKGISALPSQKDQQFTTDGGAGGVELLDWYEKHTGPFWVFLSYDKYSNFEEPDKYSNLGKYNEVIEMFISGFTYSVQKRGGSNYDFWNISVNLEEV